MLFLALLTGLSLAGMFRFMFHLCSGRSLLLFQKNKEDYEQFAEGLQLCSFLRRDSENFKRVLLTCLLSHGGMLARAEC